MTPLAGFPQIEEMEYVDDDTDSTIPSWEELAATRAERDAIKMMAVELFDALRRYESDAEGEAPSEHRQMMNRARKILFEHEDDQD
jgi:hypothetical protein